MEVSPEGISYSGGEMNPAPHGGARVNLPFRRIDNLEIKKFNVMTLFLVEIICLNTEGGAG